MKLETPLDFWSVKQFTHELDNDSLEIISPTGFNITLRSEGIFQFIADLIVLSSDSEPISVPGSPTVIRRDGRTLSVWTCDPWVNGGFEKNDIIGSVSSLAVILNKFLCKTTTIPLSQ